MKKSISALIVLCLLSAAVSLFASAEGGVVFTEQPVGADVDNFTGYTITWKTEGGDCEYMLQSSSDNKVYGNVEFVTSPYTFIAVSNQTQYFRIDAITKDENMNDIDCYSDVFKVTWRPAADLTTAEIEPIDFGEKPLGYSPVDAVPVVIKNTGKYDIRDPQLELGYGIDQIFEIIQNKEPHNIKVGETDSETWSIRPRDGLGIGYNGELIYLSAKNFEDYECANLVFSVAGSEVEMTYELSCDDIDLGTFVYGYPEPDTTDVVLRASGTGNLTGVQAYTENNTFFRLYANNSGIDLTAGTNSMTNWYIRLNSGLDAGEYEGEIKAYSNETPDPITIKVRAKITAQNETETAGPATNNDTENTAETGNTENTGTENVTTTDETDKAPDDSKTNITPIIIGVIAGVAVICAVVIITVIKNKKS